MMPLTEQQLADCTRKTQPQMYWRVKTSRVRSLCRGLRRAIDHQSRDYDPQTQIRVNLDTQKLAEQYKANQWIYVENFFPDDLYNQIRSLWPPRYFFSATRNMMRPLDRCFRWESGQDFACVDHAKQFPFAEKLQAYFASQEFCSQVAQITGSNSQMKLRMFDATFVSSGAYIPVHIDSAQRLSRSSEMMQWAIFIDGGPDGDTSGALRLTRTPNYDDVIVCPPRLQNTALGYSTGHDYYHGFPPVAHGNFRWSLNLRFIPMETES